MEKLRNKPFVSLTLCAILSSVIKSCTVPLRTASSFGPASPCCTHHPPNGHLVAVLVITSTVLQCMSSSNPYIYLKMAPKCKSSDPFDLNMPKRSCNVLQVKRCVYRNEDSIYRVLSAVSGIYWGSWETTVVITLKKMFSLYHFYVVPKSFTLTWRHEEWKSTSNAIQ